MDLLLQHYESSSDESTASQEERTEQQETQRGKVTVLQSNGDDNRDSLSFQRSQPHVRGNWAGHVYVPIDSSLLKTSSSSSSALPLVLLLRDAWIDALERAGWTGPLLDHSSSSDDRRGQLHVSLSRPFYLQQASIESFVSALSERLQHVRFGTMRLQASRAEVLVNDNQTRSFLTLPIRSSCLLTTLISHVDAVLAKYGQDPYYEPPRFHVSLASIPGVVESVSSVRLCSSPCDLVDVVLPLTELHCTFGTTKAYTIPLR